MAAKYGRSRHARTHRTAKGKAVRSKFEKEVLDDLDRRGIEYGYETEQFAWVDKVRNGECLSCGGTDVVKNRVYVPDVVLSPTDVIEIKGLFTADDRKTIEGALDSNAGLRIRLLFLRDGWLTKAKKTSYQEWCARRKIISATGKRVPDAWIRDRR